MHLVETMAYSDERPWHGLGNRLAPQQSIETWKQQTGMDWQIDESEVRYITGSNNVGISNAFPEQKVLYRSDTKAPLAVVSKRFQVVQPGEILEFYRDLTAYSGFELETAGVLRAGRKFWALARTGQSTTLRGRDNVDGYLLLATACDGTLATTAQFTSVRVVCNNTLSIALGNASGAIKVPHRSQFNPEAVKRQLGITVSSWDGFVARMKALCERPVDPDSAEGLLRRVLTYAGPEGKHAVVNEQALANVRYLYEGGGRGALMASSRGTAWGLLNSVTEYVDHHRRARSEDHRRDESWFGQGAQIKQRAWDEVMKLVA
ncbi:phage/plasmid-like protein TIGR03299 [Stenotrophomonas maltophilia]|nr:phage/plasmid-like protein TIGR03299 [Stenotrophomonas maltophilia]